MQWFKHRAGAVLSLAAVILAATTGVGLAHGHTGPHKLPADYAQWTRVAVCEEGGWYAPGGNYVDALGIDTTNWLAAGGKPQYGHLSLAQRIYEIKVADRFIRAYHIGIPDQGYCSAW